MWRAQPTPPDHNHRGDNDDDTRNKASHKGDNNDHTNRKTRAEVSQRLAKWSMSSENSSPMPPNLPGPPLKR